MCRKLNNDDVDTLSSIHIQSLVSSINLVERVLLKELSLSMTVKDYHDSEFYNSFKNIVLPSRLEYKDDDYSARIDRHNTLTTIYYPHLISLGLIKENTDDDDYNAGYYVTCLGEDIISILDKVV